MSVAENGSRTVRWRRVLWLVPLGIFLGLVVLFLIQLNAGDPSFIPSALIGHQAPQTTLPPIAGLERDGAPVPGIDPADFKGAVTVVNVWASWCVPCHDEAPLLSQLGKDTRFRLVGINYKDDPDNARRFLGRYGDPFVAAGADQSGRAAIDWGVYGVPETFVIGREAASPTSSSGRSRLRITIRCSSRRSRKRWRRGRSGGLQTRRYRFLRPRISSEAAFAARRTEKSAASRRTP